MPFIQNNLKKLNTEQKSIWLEGQEDLQSRPLLVISVSIYFLLFETKSAKRIKIQ